MTTSKNYTLSSFYTPHYHDWTRCKIVASQTSKEECYWNRHAELERIDEIRSNKRLWLMLERSLLLRHSKLIMTLIKDLVNIKFYKQNR